MLAEQRLAARTAMSSHQPGDRNSMNGSLETLKPACPKGHILDKATPHNPSQTVLHTGHQGFKHMSLKHMRGALPLQITMLALKNKRQSEKKMT